MLEQDGITGHSPAGRRSRLRISPLVLVVCILAAIVIGGFAGGVAFRSWTDSAPKAVAPVTEAVSAGFKASANPSEAAAQSPSGSPAAVYAAVGPSVVMVSVNSQHPGSFTTQPVQGLGTGFVIDDQGNILTNNHVIEGARSVYVMLADGTKVTAAVVGSDPSSDLAVVKASIPRDKLVVSRLGDSSKLLVGDPVVAIGSPFGLDQTLTSGVVSALNRTFGDAAGRPMRGLIQTDAPINPGNSGGPLLNMQGEVVGITTSIESPVRASVGIGFAIPINTAKGLLPRIIKGQAIEHPWLGISGLAITPDVAESAQLPVQKGVLVAVAIAGGPAAKAGIRGGEDRGNGSVPKGGDVITAVDGKEVATIEEISGYLDTKQVGDAVSISLLRDGKVMQIDVTLQAWPKSQSQAG